MGDDSMVGFVLGKLEGKRVVTGASVVGAVEGLTVGREVGCNDNCVQVVFCVVCTRVGRVQYGQWQRKQQRR